MLEKYKVDVSKRGACKRKRRAVGVEDGPDSQEEISTSKSEETTARRQSYRGQGTRFAGKARHAGELYGKGGDDAAATDEDHGFYD